jgi:hypothetical protein
LGVFAVNTASGVFITSTIIGSITWINITGQPITLTTIIESFVTNACCNAVGGVTGGVGITPAIISITWISDTKYGRGVNGEFIINGHPLFIFAIHSGHVPVAGLWNKW